MHGLLRLGVLLDTLHEVLVGREVDTTNRLDDEIKDDEGAEFKKTDSPPAELTTEVVEEVVADEVDVHDGAIHAGEDDLPKPPAGDGQQEAEPDDDILVVCLEDAAMR